MSPSILIVDEPTSNLNSHNSELVMNVLKEINNKGVTLFIATHDANDADQATTKLNLFDGEIIVPSEFKSVYQ
jgi:putative ABC transport system ATP-binding protein